MPKLPWARDGPAPSSHPTYQSDFARVGSNIYAIGGFINGDNASSSAMVMDCCSHTWHEAQSMWITRVTPSTCVLDGKICNRMLQKS
ncbi:putative F-box/kelch-repeat protein [Cardamine amara subsp. amara]|uniref:F-box/kelch-repeat protein n=1 Tax=Cardamine amara subsp. amara TaxID=228776 RepID=A0ABD0ZY06_CARAN